MTKTIKEIIGDYEVFLRILLRHLREKSFDIDQLHSDHICYRVSSQENYVARKEEFLNAGHQLLSETIVNGRNICTFKLAEPIKYLDPVNGKERIVPLVELPSPKPGRPQLDGLEHAEFVFSQDFQEFIDQHKTRLESITDAKLVLDALKKELNADVEIEFDLTDQDKIDINHPKELFSQRRTFSAKFHHQSLEKVIEIEKQLDIKTI